MKNWYLHNGLVYRNKRIKKESILIEAGRITALGPEADERRASLGDAINDLDLQDQLISRGFIDFHVHLREPGFEHKETIATGTSAAAAGGFTTVCPMPNTNPSLDSMERLRDLEKQIHKTAEVQVVPIAALTHGRKGQTPVDFKSFQHRGVLLFSDDGDPLEEHIAEEVFLGVKAVDGVLINHLEDKALVGEGFFYDQIPSKSEYLMLKRDLELVRRTRCRYHAAHLSCKESVDLIRRAKEEGLPVTAEVTPHHLTFSYLDIQEPKGHFQMKPPLRSEEDRQALLEGLKTGVIDLVATDHAPHGAEKEGGLFPGSPFGVTGLETAFPALYSYLVVAGDLSLERLLESLTVAPARLLGLAEELALGAPADLVILDLQREKTVTKEDFKSKGSNSAYLGDTLKGWPTLTLVAGEVKYRLMLPS